SWPVSFLTPIVTISPKGSAASTFSATAAIRPTFKDPASIRFTICGVSLPSYLVGLSTLAAGGVSSQARQKRRRPQRHKEQKEYLIFVSFVSLWVTISEWPSPR